MVKDDHPPPRPTQTVRFGDCMQILPKLAPESAQLVLADPPYGIAYESTKGVRIANDDNPFIWWMREAFRVVADRGAMLCFCRWDVQEVFRVAAQSAGFTLKSQVVWDKDWPGMGDTTATFSPVHEVIWFATKGRFKFPGGRPRSVIRGRRPASQHRTHPTEKPVELLEQLITATTRPGDLIVDPFAGTGSSGVAAKRTGRSWTGIELHPEYVEIARSRIRSVRRCAE